MTALNHEAPFDDPSPEPQGYQRVATFRRIVAAAAALGFLGKPDEFHLTIEGHVRVGDRSYGTVLSYVPEGHHVVRHTILACPVTHRTDQFHVKFHQANAAVIGAKAICETEDWSVRVESCVDCPASSGEILGRLARLFRSADEMLNNEHLWTALAIGDAVLLGTPAALWDVA